MTKGLVRVAAAVVVISTKPWGQCISFDRFNPIELLFQLSIPAVIGMTVIGLYPLMDGIFAGNIIGQTAMTACGVAATLTIFDNGVIELRRTLHHYLSERCFA